MYGDKKDVGSATFVLIFCCTNISKGFSILSLCAFFATVKEGCSVQHKRSSPASRSERMLQYPARKKLLRF